MNKKLIAVAVAGALGAPGMALAQASSVQVYGTLVINYNYVDSGGVPFGGPSTFSKTKTDLINNHDSNLGFKGEERLGGGLTGWFQCENTMDVTGQSAAGGASNWCGRNSAFGMKGSFGNVWVGIWDTPMKIQMGAFRPWSTAGAYGMGDLLWNSVQSDVANLTPGVANTSFTRRQQNMISYQTPDFMGFKANVGYSAANEGATATSATVGAKPRLIGIGGTYTNGPLILGGGYETHKNFNPAGTGVLGGLGSTYTGGTDRGWSAGAAYTFMGSLKVMAMFTRNNYEVAGTTVATAGDVTQNGWGVYADWAVQGPHRIRVGYTKANDTTGSAGTLAAPLNVGNMVANGGAGQTGASLWGLQYAHNFSKRTELNFGYARVTNDNFASYALRIGAGVPKNTGNDQNAWVFGVKHTF